MYLEISDDLCFGICLHAYNNVRVVSSMAMATAIQCDRGRAECRAIREASGIVGPKMKRTRIPG
jgi:hypothetical protein